MKKRSFRCTRNPLPRRLQHQLAVHHRAPRAVELLAHRRQARLSKRLLESAKATPEAEAHGHRTGSAVKQAVEKPAARRHSAKVAPSGVIAYITDCVPCVSGNWPVKMEVTEGFVGPRRRRPQ